MFVQIMLMLSQIALAEPVENTEETVSSEIKEAELKAFYESKKEEDTSITVDIISEEAFEMDLSGLNVAVPATEIVEDLSVEGVIDSEDLSDNGADAPTATAPVEAFEWNLDLNEDLEIGSGKLEIEPKPKSEPVNLDFLDDTEE